jgi:hypothetical protein
MTDEELENLLPWYVNDTLSEEEREAVEALLSRSEQARDQLAFLQRLSQQIQDEPRDQVPELEWRRFQHEIQNTSRKGSRNWWKPGLAIAASVIMTLQISILAQRPSTDSDIQLLSQGIVISSLEGPHWRMQIEFHDNSSWQEISNLIYRVHGTIIEGPSSIGLLRIAVPENNSEYNSPEALLSWLRQQPQVIHAAIESN